MTLAEPLRRSTAGKQPGRNLPISRHPLFPAIVGLWFAALVALGSLAVSTSLIERVVLAAQLDTLLPAAAPPLGVTARLLLALMLGIAAGVAGWILARRLTQTRPAPRPQVFEVNDADLGPGLPWPMASETAEPGEAEAAAPELVEPGLATVEIEPADHVADVSPSATAAQRIATGNLVDLSQVELIERLAIALQQRHARLEPISGDAGAAATGPVVRFPDLADRQCARMNTPGGATRPAPQETEKALREALSALQRMSSGA